MYLDSVLEQEYPVKFLRLWANGTLCKPLILHGPSGVGKHFAAQQAIADFFRPHDLMAVKNHHPDLTLIQSQGSIGVDEIRELIGGLTCGPSLGRAKVCLVDDASALTTSAADGLLKTVEDQSVRFLFVTSSLESVIPTLKSRCGLLRFNPLSEEVVRAHLVSVGVDRADVIAGLGQGSIGDSVRAWADDHLGYVPKIKSFMELLQNKKYHGAFQLLDQEKRPEVFLLVLSKILHSSMSPGSSSYPPVAKATPDKIKALEKIVHSPTPINKVYHVKALFV